jgi:hypothetical protein
MAGPERHVNERAPDSDAEEREELIRQETAKRHGRKPSYHKHLWSIRIKLPPHVLALCRKQYKTAGAKEYWRRAAYAFVGLDADAPSADLQQGKKHRRGRKGA